MNWEPFVICEPSEQPAPPRSVKSILGLGDRMRTAAFAEFQAVRAFSWAADHFQDAADGLRHDWREQIADEKHHFEMIVQRMAELNIAPDERPVSLRLWTSLSACVTARDFCIYICSAEERGRQAAILLSSHLQDRDPQTARIFTEIAEDEVAHVALADTYFQWKPSR